MYMLMAAAAMRDMGRLYAPMQIPVPGILSRARAEYWSQAESELPKKVGSPATLVDEDEKKLRSDFSHSLHQGYSAKIGDSKFGIDRELEIFNEERDKHKAGKNPWGMSPKQLREENK